jgi:hypothetical protein
MKFKKLPNPLIFNRNQNDFCPFITKLHLKFLINYNQYPTEASKVSYKISRLSKDAAQIINPFFHNSTFISFKIFISLLERIYNNASHKYTAVIKLKNLQ